MTHRKFILVMALAAILLSAGAANAQTAVAAAGGEAGTLSYTLGQVLTTAAGSDAGSLTAGVQQAYTITIVDGIAGTPITLEATVYPNPTADYLTLSAAGAEAQNLRYTLTDNSGRTLKTADIQSAQTQIDMTNLVPAVYFLRVDNGNATVKTFKVIKN